MANPDFVKLTEAMNITAWEAKETKDDETSLAKLMGKFAEIVDTIKINLKH